MCSMMPFMCYMGSDENYLPAVAILLMELLDRDVHWRALAQNGHNSMWLSVIWCG